MQRSVAVLRRIAESLAPFLDSRSAALTCKVVYDGQGEDPSISCDTLEVVEALGLEEVSTAAEVLQEALEGLVAADLGRAEQSRLAVLVASLFAEAATLLEAGMTPWAVRQALHRTERLAEAACERLASEQLAAELLRRLAAEEGPAGGGAGLPDFPFPLLQAEAAASAVMMDGGDNDDDVGWFFEAPAEDAFREVQLMLPGQPARRPPQQQQVPQARPAEAPAAQLRCGDELKDDVGSVCKELQRRHAAAAEEASADGRHCFVYASTRSCAKPECRLEKGVICHVPLQHLSARPQWLRGSVVREGAIFLDADLDEAAYETCAPSARRVPESLAVLGPSLLPSADAARRQALGQRVQKLLTDRSIGALFLAGEASPAVAEACRKAGALLVGAMPARLLHALATEAGAEVLAGLPEALGASDERPPWQAEAALCCELQELTPQQRRRCFSFPLLGHRQPLLPHQVGVGADAEGPCWELRVQAQSTVGAGPGSTSTVVLEAACEPVLRGLHAQVSDRLFSLLQDTSPHGLAARRLPGAGAWARAVAEALNAETLHSRGGCGSVPEAEPWVAPWLTTSCDALTDAGAMERFAEAFQQVAAQEMVLAELWSDPPDLELPGSAPEMEQEEGPSHTGTLAVLRRSFQTVQLLVNLSRSV